MESRLNEQYRRVEIVLDQCYTLGSVPMDRVSTLIPMM